MRRREFVSGLALAGLLCPSLGGGQTHPKKVARIGVLLWGSPGHDAWAEPFRQAMRELSYIEGQTVVLDLQFAEGSPDRAAASAQEFVREKVDVIVASTTPAAHVAKAATTSIPIVMAPVADALATGLVTNLARPGGNVTGISTVNPELMAKRLEILREVLPSLRRVAFLGSTRDPNASTFAREMAQAAAVFGMDFERFMVDGREGFEAAFRGMEDAHCGAVMVQPIFASQRAAIAELAIRHRIPTIGANPEFARAGVLITYAAEISKFMLQAASQVDKILKGTHPGDLPVEQPTKFDLVINLKTATALGLSVPATLLARADEVIE
jgi:putative ABC transport system substrate-binding protein